MTAKTLERPPQTQHLEIDETTPPALVALLKQLQGKPELLKQVQLVVENDGKMDRVSTALNAHFTAMVKDFNTLSFVEQTKLLKSAPMEVPLKSMRLCLDKSSKPNDETVLAFLSKTRLFTEIRREFSLAPKGATEILNRLAKADKVKEDKVKKSWTAI